MGIRTTVFELSRGKYHSLSELAQAMGISVSQVYRVRKGQRGISQKFIIGAARAFPDKTLGDLFYLVRDDSSGDRAGKKDVRNATVSKR